MYVIPRSFELMVVMHISAIRALMPYILRVVASRQDEPQAPGLLDICTRGLAAASMMSPHAAANGTASIQGGVIEMLWGDSVLDTLRLKYVMSQVFAASYSHHV